MTAINIVVQKARALVMTDAAVIDADNRLCAIEPKGVELPHLRGFMVTAGNVQVQKGFLHTLRLFDGIDDLAANGRQLCEDTNRILIERYPAMFDRASAVHVVGWSEERQAPRHVHFHNNLDGFTFWVDDPWWMSPCISDDAIPSAAKRSIVENGGLEAFRVMQDGLAIMQFQRRERLDEKDRGCFFVGGYMQLVTIAEAGVTREIVWQWPDRVGEPIQPASSFDGAPVANVAPLPVVSRQQRRAAERQRRRIA